MLYIRLKDFRFVRETANRFPIGLRPATLRQKLNLSSLTKKTISFDGPEPASGEEFENRCKRLNRPLSPHLSIYKWESNMIMSITHRFTGVYLYGIPFGLAAVAVLLPDTYPHYLNMLEEMQLHMLVTTMAKFIIALPFSFHFLNGIRHIIWDFGYLWSQIEVRRSGYILLFLAVALAVHLTFLIPHEEKEIPKINEVAAIKTP